MFNLMLFVSVFIVVVQAINEARTPKVPDEYCNNMELYYKDIVNGVPLEKCMDNLYSGKYATKIKKTTW